MAKRKKKLSKQSRASLAATSGKKPITLAWDHGAMGQANRAGLVVEERGEKDPATGKVTNPNGVTGVRRVDLLEYWHGRGSISTAGFNAACLLRDAFEATQRCLPCLPENDRVQSSPKPDASVTIQIDRISRYHSIRRHVLDHDRKLIDCCVLEGRHPSHIYGPKRIREAFEDLRNALDRMADSLGGSRSMGRV